jgi:hypothetical protein
MPRYQLSATVPVGTPEDQAVSAEIEIDQRFVQEGFIFAAPGSAYKVNAALLAGDRQLLPEPGSDTTVVPNVTDPAPIRYTLPGSPNTLELRLFAPNSDFEHTVKAVVDVVSEDQASPLQRIADRLTGGRAGPAARQPTRTLTAPHSPGRGMAEAEIIEIERTTNITATGELQDALRPVYTLGPLSGTFRTDPIPQPDYSRDLARTRVQSQAEELLAEGTDVTVAFPSG